MKSDREYAEKVVAWQARPAWKAEMKEVFRLAEVKRGDRVLDYGAGSDAAANILAGYGAHVTLVEPNKEAVALMHPHWRKRVVRPDVMHYPATVDRYDVVILAHTLGHTDDPGRVFTWCRRVLAENGRLVIVVPNPRYDRWMAPYNKVTGYKSDPTLKHALGEDWFAWRLPRVRISYMGDKVRWIPDALQEESMRSRIVVLWRNVR